MGWLIEHLLKCWKWGLEELRVPWRGVEGQVRRWWVGPEGELAEAHWQPLAAEPVIVDCGMGQAAVVEVEQVVAVALGEVGVEGGLVVLHCWKDQPRGGEVREQPTSLPIHPVSGSRRNSDLVDKDDSGGRSKGLGSSASKDTRRSASG